MNFFFYLSKKLFLPFVSLFLFFAYPNPGFANDAFTVSTFHCLSVYWSPEGGSPGRRVFVQYRKSGSSQWNDALPMKYNPVKDAGINPETGQRYDKADYRGSIVNLQPGTKYNIRLSLEKSEETTGLSASTWSENFPVGKVIKPNSGDDELIYTSLHGTASSYVLIDGTGKTIDVGNNSPECIRLTGCEYVIVRGFKLINAAESAIRLYKSHHIVIENCDMSNWGQEDVAGTGFGIDYQAGVYAGSNDIYSCVIQRNKIHHPRWDTNSWKELHDPLSDPKVKDNFHPGGPQGIALGNCSIGNNVIRYNEIWSDEDHCYNDILGMWENASYAGFPGPDSDIYGNYLANCYDDAIEAEGSNTNVRIWNNYIEKVFIGIGNAATSVGPLYVWRNVTGESYRTTDGTKEKYGGFLKMGYAVSIRWMTGHMYIFNNTVLQPGNHGLGGLGTSGHSNRYVLHCETRNNIFNVRNNTVNSISVRDENFDNSFDYDFTNKPVPEGEEKNGITGVPVYSKGSPSFNFKTKTGRFTLAPRSEGYDSGVIIPNFTSNYNGKFPDMGAHEHGTDDIVYGVKASFNPKQ